MSSGSRAGSERILEAVWREAGTRTSASAPFNKMSMAERSKRSAMVPAAWLAPRLVQAAPSAYVMMGWGGWID